MRTSTWGTVQAPTWWQGQIPLAEGLSIVSVGTLKVVLGREDACRLRHAAARAGLTDRSGLIWGAVELSN